MIVGMYIERIDPDRIYPDRGIGIRDPSSYDPGIFTSHYGQKRE